MAEGTTREIIRTKLSVTKIDGRRERKKERRRKCRRRRRRRRRRKKKLMTLLNRSSILE